MNPEDGHAANFARKMSSPTSAEYINLSGLMCWDAVMYCALRAGIIDQRKYDRLRGDQDLVALSDFAVAGPNAMYRLEPGNAIGFFWSTPQGVTMVHAMLCVGKGLAAGNKNKCVGAGNFVGWEILDLINGFDKNKGYGWHGDTGTITAPGLTEPTRELMVRYCPISYLAFK